jgi:hypothetical protein
MDCAAGEAASTPLFEGSPEKEKHIPRQWFQRDKRKKRFRVTLLTDCVCRYQLND